MGVSAPSLHRESTDSLIYTSFCTQSPSQVPSTVVSGGSVQLRAGLSSSLIQTTEDSDKRKEEEERERLTSELHEIERERLVDNVLLYIPESLIFYMEGLYKA